MLPSETLTPEQRATLARLKTQIQDSPEQLAEALAELLIYRDRMQAVRRNGFLMNHRSVRDLINQAPGSRHVPRAHLPTYRKR